MERITKEELLEMLFHDDYEHLKGKKLRMTRVRVPGKEVCLAHVISPSQSCIYENLGLHIGVHEGEDAYRGSHRVDPFYPLGGSCGGSGRCHEECGCADRVYGPFLRLPDPDRRTVTGADCGRRGCALF